MRRMKWENSEAAIFVDLAARLRIRRAIPCEEWPDERAMK